MKFVIIPLTEDDVSGCDCFAPTHSFKANWCLDLYGYLSADEFQKQLKTINDYIKAYPLLSTKSKKILSYIFGGLYGFTLLTLVLITFTASFQGSSVSSLRLACVVLHLLAGIAFLAGRKIADNVAKNRANAFKQAMQPLLDKINLAAYPTANWKLVWRDVLTHYSVNIESNGKGKATPKYAEHAELVIEIHDGLSARTAHTIHVNIPTAVSTKQLSQMATLS
ncbi:10686_t:CDS:1 [Paraglomus occultum]|uniref:10686_t:CDS:1 n=1 Tax=Paraglomus occultum TaxID=144539 RepID=A0A9N9B9E1_9GLOM|nr:10686_t:CDS:1 [Paraglomus occultum]